MQITGRPHGVYRKLKISRIALRQLGLEGKNTRNGKIELVERKL